MASKRTDAPSLMEEALAAVIAPSFENAGLSADIFSGLNRVGSSSAVTTISPRLLAIVMGTISS